MKTVQVAYSLPYKRPINKQFPFLPYTRAHFYCSTISLLDESEEEGVVQLLTREEEEVEAMQSWVEVGVSQPDQSWKPRGYWQRQVHPFVPHSSFLSLLFNWY